MIKIYRKKPIAVETLEWTGEDDCWGELLCWIEATDTKRSFIHSKNKNLIIGTLEGDMTASVGDIIIKGVDNEFYPCKPDIFAKTYEEVNDGR